MPGPFTNKWDNTFPPDTEFAYLYANNLRAFRTDIQQRMASISGLDADRANLNFWADETTPPTGAPANWDGVLFFATDTGKIYQFQYNSANSSTPVNNWVDVSLRLKPAAVKDSHAQSFTSQIGTQPQPYTDLTYPPLLPTTRMRITVNYNEISIQGGGGGGLFVSANNVQAVMDRIMVGTPTYLTHTVILEGGNVGATNSQSWIWADVSYPVLTTPVTTNFETNAGGFFQIGWHGIHTTSPYDAAVFYGAMLELM